MSREVGVSVLAGCLFMSVRVRTSVCLWFCFVLFCLFVRLFVLVCFGWLFVCLCVGFFVLFVFLGFVLLCLFDPSNILAGLQITVC